MTLNHIKKINIRRMSFNILYDVFFHKVLLNVAYDNEYSKYDETLLNSLKNEDKAFIKRETAGTIENLDILDNKIDEFSNVKVKKLDKDILIILRLAIYELLYMDKVPKYATINEYVNIVKHSKNGRLEGFVNGVLRSIQRDIDWKDVNIKKNIGTKIVRLEKKIINKFCYFRILKNNEKEVITELNDKKISYYKYNGSLDFNFAKAYYVNKYKDIINTEGFRKGYILIQDASSIYLTEKLFDYIMRFLKDDLSLNKAEQVYTCNILDACAAPGGKGFGLYDLFINNNDFKDKVSYFNFDMCDVTSDKVNKLRENSKLLNIINSVNFKIKDATKYDEKLNRKYKVVILDVPCTGLGVIANKPDIKLNYSDKKKDALVKIQRQILNVNKRYVDIGGLLSYSTCTTTDEENKFNIEWFLGNNKNFTKLFDKKINLNDDSKCSGFYMCIMKRIG